jgi:hypothetical protein
MPLSGHFFFGGDAFLPLGYLVAREVNEDHLRRNG